ncbi:MAG: hypothetical protein COW02_05480 [Comamonadaceae bacterium CG12_big_fil_rev_8_21_14_0_65_59_15]|nr:MAG: hypothetical protein COW02_05480 [Comamonadaceae bacterium CG12_big_fil_rev_8_21_14_0_65_59_15]
MQRYSVVFSPEAAEQLDALYAYVAAAASPATALSYTNAIVTYCEGLSISPHRGSRRDDVRPGLRVTNYKKRAVIAFTVDGGKKGTLPFSVKQTAAVGRVVGVFTSGTDIPAMPATFSFHCRIRIPHYRMVLPLTQPLTPCPIHSTNRARPR